LDFENPYPSILPEHVWRKLLAYYERSGCFHSGSWPQAGCKHTQRLTRKGHLTWDQGEPALCMERGTGPRKGFGDFESDEVGALVFSFSRQERTMIEFTVYGIVINAQAHVMRHAAKVLRLSKRHCFRIRKVAFERLAMECEKRNL
jgi:hypothetical protein